MEDTTLLRERYILARDRIKEVENDLANPQSEKSLDPFFIFFSIKSRYINMLMNVYELLWNTESENTGSENTGSEKTESENTGSEKAESENTDSGNVRREKITADILYDKSVNYLLYEDIIGDNYAHSYSNPAYAEKTLGSMGGLFSYISAEIQGLVKYVFDNKLGQIVYLLEMFLELYFLFLHDENVNISSVEDVVYYYAFDYIEYFSYDRMSDTMIPEQGLGYSILENENLEDFSYLYKYGEYISDTEILLARYLNSLPEEKIKSIAHVYTDGFRRGFDVMGIDFTGKNSVNIRYHIGQERIVREAIAQFREMGLKPIISRQAVNRTVRRGVTNQGYAGTFPNKQFEYDHRNDNAYFLDARFVDRRINATASAYDELEQYTKGFAGPAVIESFGEELFSPVPKDSVPVLTDEQQTLSVKLSNELGALSDKAIPGDSYSFTIISFPLPDIGEDFEAIFDETIALNSLDNDKYIIIQQSIIDTLDVADHVRVIGMNGNHTDMTVKLRSLENPAHQTQFENCTADVNIPLGEVFTSPVLKGTNGILHVSSTYLNGYNFENIQLEFKDGLVTDYSCSNFDDLSEKESMEAGKRYIKENVLFNHPFLPMGEFAIGTNTLAYKVARKFNILEKLPILIVEKTGPHFAVGDTCYSHMEDHAVFNPDGKEIISRENDFSLLRDTDPEKAYFNCHTDITIPYNELGRLYTVNKDGTEVDIIVKGRFVLPGTEALNAALE